MENAFTFVIIAVVALIVALLAAYAIKQVKSGQQQANAATDSLNEVTSEYSNPKLQAYDGMTVYGKEVQQVITDAVNDGTYGVLVHTSAAGNSLWTKPLMANSIRVLYKGTNAHSLHTLANAKHNDTVDGSKDPVFADYGVYTHNTSKANSSKTTEFSKIYDQAGQTIKPDDPTVKLVDSTTDENWINPDGTFVGAVYKDDNNNVTLIEFTQK
jgi:hypothetical protein